MKENKIDCARTSTCASSSQDATQNCGSWSITWGNEMEVDIMEKIGLEIQENIDNTGSRVNALRQLCSTHASGMTVCVMPFGPVASCRSFMGIFGGGVVGGGLGLRVSRIIRRGVKIIVGISPVRRRGWGVVPCVMRLHILSRYLLWGRRSCLVGEAGSVPGKDSSV